MGANNYVHVEIEGSSKFLEANISDCPFQVSDMKVSKVEGAAQRKKGIEMVLDKKNLLILLKWFDKSTDNDLDAALCFPDSLSKYQRALVHRSATGVGLQTASEGTGEERRVCVFGAHSSRAQQSPLDDKSEHKAFWTWTWACEAGMEVSRDEVRELVRRNNEGGELPQELEDIWNKGRVEQQAVGRLCAAVTAGDLQAVNLLLTPHHHSVEEEESGSGTVGGEGVEEVGVLRRGVVDCLSGATPLHCAAVSGQVVMIETLLHWGANLEATDGRGRTALMMARISGQDEVVDFLIRQGARDPKNPDADEGIPLGPRGTGLNKPELNTKQKKRKERKQKKKASLHGPQSKNTDPKPNANAISHETLAVGWKRSSSTYAGCAVLAIGVSLVAMYAYGRMYRTSKSH